MVPRPLRNRYLGQRHGESEANVAGIVLSDPAEGVPRWGLTPAGRAQIEAAIGVAAELLGSSPSEVVVVSSDFKRTRETAELSVTLLGAGPARLDEALRERFFGAHEGLGNERYESVWARDREEPTHTEEGVESAHATALRTASLIERLEGEASGQTYLLVSHGDALQLLQTAFLGESPATHRERPHWPPAEVRLLGGPGSL
ncbi:MAG: histidine phosphatase family protein [Planctomycetes bacterium]|nr:histidine phosphatase family protein [Planctomycetota bacterium]